MTSKVRGTRRIATGFRYPPFSTKGVESLFLLGLLVGLAIPEVTRGQREALSIEDAIRARDFAGGSRIQFSPDGKWLAYNMVRSHAAPGDQSIPAGVPWFARGADICVVDVAAGKQQVITGGEFDNWRPSWSPTGQYLAFLSDRDRSGLATLWIWNARDGGLKKVSDTPAGVGPIEWMPEGRQILFSHALGAQVPASASAGARSSGPQIQGATVTVYERSTQANSDSWNLASYTASLELADIESGKTETVVQGQLATYKLSPDGRHLAFTVAKRFEKAGSQQILFDLRVLETKSGESRTLVADARLEPDGSGFRWSPDGRQLCLRANDEEVATYWMVSVDGKEPRKLTAARASRVNSRQAPLWDQAGQMIYFLNNGELWRGDATGGQMKKVAEVPGRVITQIIPGSTGALWDLGGSSVLVLTHDDEGKQDGIYAIDTATGRSSKLMEQGQCYTCVIDEPSLAVLPEQEKVAFVAEDGAHSPDLWLTDTRFQSLRQLTHLNPRLEADSMGKARLVEWLSDDGERLKGVLVLPSDYQPGKRYPLVTYIYGGAFLSNRLDWFGFANTGPLNMQLLATRGYAVFLPDTPQRPGTPMLSLAKTVLPGVSKVIELGYADPDRLAVMGHSYGGYSALSLIVQTTRFKAAVVMAGDGDLFGFYGEMRDDGTAYGVAIAEQGQVGIGGTPWQRRDGYIENSPFFYYDRIETPVLIIQGTDDTAVASFLADQTFVALRRLGKEVEYDRYAGENHSPAQEWRYSNQVDLCNRMIAWFEKHLKGSSQPSSAWQQLPASP